MKIQRRRINETARRFLSTIFAALTFLALAPVGFSQVVDTLADQGRTVPKETGITPEMVPLIKDKDEKGDPKAQFVLGWTYFIRFGLEKNNVNAVNWMMKAANQGYAPAQNEVGLFYLSAKDIPGNYSLAREWLVKAADLGKADALNIAPPSWSRRIIRKQRNGFGSPPANNIYGRPTPSRLCIGMAKDCHRILPKRSVYSKSVPRNTGMFQHSTTLRRCITKVKVQQRI